MNSTQQNSYTDRINYLTHQKSGLLLRARRLQRDGASGGETPTLFSKAAEIETQIAQLLEDTADENAIIHWMSAASCYMQARNYQRALELFDRILEQTISPQLRRDAEKFRRRCYAKTRKA
jgi:pentatricopeptide repeat protein